MSGVKPALAPEEWAAREWRKDEGDDCYQFVMVAPHGALQCGTWNEGHGVGDVTGDLSPEGRHAVAALALDGQPFGFTRAMVEALRDALACSGTVSSPDNLPLAREAIERIEALLPPEES